VNRSILLVDDDAALRAALTRSFERAGWQVHAAAEAAGAALIYDRERPDLVLLDLHMPGISGMRLLELLRLRDPDATIILLTGTNDLPTAVRAMQLGAENFLTKPIELPHLHAAAERAFEKVALRRRNRYFTERQTGSAAVAELGDSRRMRELAKQVEILAASDAPVLLLGESGTGKGFVARMIHSLSPRSAAPFVDVNCAGVSAFVEAELFGREQGAGGLGVADAGSLFLDEIGDLEADLQLKLLEVLERQRFRRFGAMRDVTINVRFIAASSRDMEAAVQAGRFRKDLYYRLAVVALRLPSLRERGSQEIMDLAMRTLLELRSSRGRGPQRFSHAALGLIAEYEWPGNIRELRNALERVLLLTDGADEVLPAHLPPEVRGERSRLDIRDETELPLQEIERRHIARVLAHVNGNRSRAARVLGISRATLYEKIDRYELTAIGRGRGNGLRTADANRAAGKGDVGATDADAAAGPPSR
jgi:DNA-binding NtrC family response regulator